MLGVFIGTSANKSRSSLDALNGSANGESAVIIKYICIVEDWSNHAGIEVLEGQDEGWCA